MAAVEGGWGGWGEGCVWMLAKKKGCKLILENPHGGILGEARPHGHPAFMLGQMQGFSHRRGAAAPLPPHLCRKKNKPTTPLISGSSSSPLLGGWCRFLLAFKRKQLRPGPAAAALAPLRSSALPRVPKPLQVGARSPSCLQPTGKPCSGGVQIRCCLPCSSFSLGLDPAASPSRGG